MLLRVNVSNAAPVRIKLINVLNVPAHGPCAGLWPLPVSLLADRSYVADSQHSPSYERRRLIYRGRTVMLAFTRFTVGHS